MGHPGEQFYPSGLAWDAPIPTGTLPDLLDEASAKFAQRPLIEFNGRQISYRQFQEAVDKVAAGFVAYGIGKDHTVALFLGNSPDQPINFFGALKAGARLVQISPFDGDRARRHKIADSGARHIVTSNETRLLSVALELLEEGLIETIIVCDSERWASGETLTSKIPGRASVIAMDDFILGKPRPLVWPAIAHSDVALLQYTGGTTGLSKGAILTHGSLFASAVIHELWGAQSRHYPIERVVCVLPLSHIFAITYVLLLRIRKGDLVSLHSGFDVEAVLRDVTINRASTLPAVPTMWIAIANHPGLEEYDLSSLKCCISGGAPLPVEVVRRLELRARLSPIVSAWGLTETAGVGSHNPWGGPIKHDSIGIMFPRTEIEVVDQRDSQKILPPREIGELRIRGPSLFTGYWNRPDETAKSIVNGWLLTGDIGYRDEDGYLYLVDRKNDMIISGGLNVYPQIVEQAIYEHPSVMEVGVVGLPDPYWGEAVTAFVKLRVDAEPFTIDDLRSFLSNKLGKHEIPSRLQFLPELPKTAVGKLSRQELRSAASRDAPN